MDENKGRELTKRELHMDFGGEVLYRKYNVYSGDRYGVDNSYIYQDDVEIRERMEELEWEENYKKKCQKMLDEKNK
jgi:hypothetical protein